MFMCMYCGNHQVYKLDSKGEFIYTERICEDCTPITSNTRQVLTEKTYNLKDKRRIIKLIETAF